MLLSRILKWRLVRFRVQDRIQRVGVTCEAQGCWIRSSGRRPAVLVDPNLRSFYPPGSDSECDAAYAPKSNAATAFSTAHADILDDPPYACCQPNPSSAQPAEDVRRTTGLRPRREWPAIHQCARRRRPGTRSAFQPRTGHRVGSPESSPRYPPSPCDG